MTALHVTSALLTSEDLEPTLDEIAKRYDQDKLEHYKHEELRSLRYVSWEKQPSNEDTLEAKDLSLDILQKSKIKSRFCIPCKSIYHGSK